jgi:hypothetical protein
MIQTPSDIGDHHLNIGPPESLCQIMCQKRSGRFSRRSGAGRRGGGRRRRRVAEADHRPVLARPKRWSMAARNAAPPEIPPRKK